MTRQRGAGLGWGMRHGWDTDLLLLLQQGSNGLPPSAPSPHIFHCFSMKVKHINSMPPVDSLLTVGTVYLCFTHCASPFISRTGSFCWCSFLPCDALHPPPFAFVLLVSQSVRLFACFLHILMRSVVQWHAIYTESVFNFPIKMTAQKKKKPGRLCLYFEAFVYTQTRPWKMTNAEG